MKLPTTQLLGYAAGDSANNLVFSMASMFLLVYYTDVAGIPATAAGTIFLVVRIWDGVADLIAGRLVDRTSTRWGKFRPWLLFGSAPLLLLSAAVFWMPDWGPGGKLFYAYMTYAALVMAYSLVNIPYGAMAAVMTQDPGERTKLAAARSMGATATGMMLSFVVAPQMNDAENLQRSLTTTVLVFAVLGFGLYVFNFLTARENVERDVEHVSLKESLNTLRRNRPLVVLCLSSLLFLTALYSVQTIGVYYARDVLGNASYMIAITLATAGTMFLVAPLAPKIVRTFGKKHGYIYGGLTVCVGSIGVMFTPASLPVLALAFFVVMGFGKGLVNTLMWSLEADTVEYGEWKTGTRTEGTTYAVFSFTRNLGQAAGSATAAYTIGLAGYVAGANAQSPSAEWGIRAAAGLIPAALVLAAIALIAAYPLTEKTFRELTSEVARRRAERGAQPSRPQVL